MRQPKLFFNFSMKLYSFLTMPNMTLFSSPAYHLVIWEEEGSWSVVAGKAVDKGAGVGDVVTIKVGRASYKATIVDSGIICTCMNHANSMAGKRCTVQLQVRKGRWKNEFKSWKQKKRKRAIKKRKRPMKKRGRRRMGGRWKKSKNMVHTCIYTSTCTCTMYMYIH